MQPYRIRSTRLETNPDSNSSRGSKRVAGEAGVVEAAVVEAGAVEAAAVEAVAHAADAHVVGDVPHEGEVEQRWRRLLNLQSRAGTDCTNVISDGLTQHKASSNGG